MYAFACIVSQRDSRVFPAPRRTGAVALLDRNTAATLSTTQTVAKCDEWLEAHRDLLPPALRR